MGIATGIATLLLAFSPHDAAFNAGLTSRMVTLTMVQAADTAPVAGVAIDFPELIQRIYTAREGAALWVDRSDAATEIPALIDRFADAGSHGLDPRTYPLRRLRDLSLVHVGGPPGEAAALDILLTDTVLGYLADLTGQRLQMPLPEDLDPAPARAADLVALALQVATGASPPALAVEAAAPQSEAYDALRVVLRQLRKREAAGGWPLLTDGPSLRPGERDPRVPLLRSRLLGVTVPDSLAQRYGDPLAAAVRRAQQRFGLVADGIVGPRTLAALNTPVEVRRRQVEFSLERLRCLPHDLGIRYVRVDVLQGRLQVVDSDTVVTQMRTIVGKPERPTPMVSSRITSLEVNPFWNIPQKLAREDVLPKILRDPSYLPDHGIHVFANWRPGAAEIDPFAVDWPAIDPEELPFKLQQQPGPGNPLGRVKFLFYNPYSVYIHDTPYDYKFTLPERFFSSGCVRVEEPLRLAEALLDEQFEDFTEALDSGDTVALPLSRPVDVHLVYLTAWVDESGAACFRDDVYGYDAEMAPAAQTELAAGAEALPGTDGTGVDVDEAGTRIVADATGSLP